MIKRAYVLSLIALVVLSAFVLAAGSSSGNAEEDEEVPARTTSQVTTCEGAVTLRERIKCRMENPSVAHREAYDATEEACRGSTSTKMQACERLYSASAYCYNEANLVERKRCFLKESGISINAGGTFRAAPDDNKRNYVILLLYELQERIETMEEEGKITVDQATSLIAKIVEIKKMIIAGESRADIVVNINQFKQEYRTVMAGVQQ